MISRSSSVMSSAKSGRGAMSRNTNVLMQGIYEPRSAMPRAAAAKLATRLTSVNQPSVVMLEGVMVLVGFDAECLAPRCAGTAGADQQGGTEGNADGAGDGPQRGSGHEKAAAGAGTPARPHQSGGGKQGTPKQARPTQAP